MVKGLFFNRVNAESGALAPVARIKLPARVLAHLAPSPFPAFYVASPLAKKARHRVVWHLPVKLRLPHGPNLRESGKYSFAETGSCSARRGWCTSLRAMGTARPLRRSE